MALIIVNDLKKIYDNEDVATPAVNGVSFNIEAGEFVAIMGPSGSGKSTLLHILGFLDKPTTGEYRFDDKTIDGYSETEIARVRNKKMGFIFQMFNLLRKTTVLDNVKLPLLYSGVKEAQWSEMAKQAIEKVGLSHRLNHLPSQLSGGEQQRVAIARALINNPQVVFADEPTGNLDTKSGGAIIDLLQSLNRKEGRTIVMITHEPDIANHAKRIIYLRDGKIESDRLVKLD